MVYVAKHRFAPISASKARLVADQVRGKMIYDALNICRFSRKRAACFIKKVIESAQANARDRDNAPNLQDLYIKGIRVDEGPTKKKWRCRARGMASPIMDRSSHITVELDLDEQ